MNIFIREMKAHRKGLILWIIGMLFMIVASMGKYVATSQTGGLNEMMAKMPKSMQAIMGTGTFDLTKVSGYYGILFIYIILIATIHGAMIGADIISKEERDKTSEFLLVKPVSRKNIITSKLLAAIANIVILNICTLIVSLSTVNKYGNGEDVTQDIVILMIGMFILQVMFMVIGTSIAAVLKNPKVATSISTGILLTTFLISLIIDISSNFQWLKYLTPFKYFEAKNLMYGGGFDLVFVILSLVIIGALTTVTYIFYNKRDLNN